MYITTKQLRENLSHCYGKNTVEVIHYKGNNFVFHYNALICVINEQRVIFNIPYYDYSGPTSRVRNRACEMVLGKSWTTSELRKHEKGYKNSTDVYFANLAKYRIFDYEYYTEVIGNLLRKGAFDIIWN